jgi:hypothetical protein
MNHFDYRFFVLNNQFKECLRIDRILQRWIGSQLVQKPEVNFFDNLSDVYNGTGIRI